MTKDQVYAQDVLNSPVSSALLDSPVSKQVSDAQLGFAWWIYWILWWVWGALVWWPAWAAMWTAIWWAGTMGLWSIIESKSENWWTWKWFWAWMKQWGMLMTSAWVWKLAFTTFFPAFATAIWTYLALNVLLYFLTWKKAEAKKIIEDQTWDWELADSIMIQLDKQWVEDLKGAVNWMSDAESKLQEIANSNEKKNVGKKSNKLSSWWWEVSTDFSFTFWSKKSADWDGSIWSSSSWGSDWWGGD